MRTMDHLKNTLIALAVFSALAVLILGLAGRRLYIVQSGSMEPAIRTGSLAVVNTKAGYENVGAGDVICFEASNGVLIIHRAVSISEDGIETKGDNNKTEDGIITTEKTFRGTVSFSIPLLGYVFAFLGGRKGRILIFTLIAVIVVFSVFRTMEEKERRKKANNIEKKGLP